MISTQHLTEEEISELAATATAQAIEQGINTTELGVGEDANIAAIRASQLLFRVLSQCSVRLGFASLNPSPLQLQQMQTLAKGQSIPVLFSTWAAKECASFLQLFELERSASAARQKLMQMSLKVRFRERLLEDRLTESRMEVWEKRVRQSQRELYRQISGKTIAIRTRLSLMRKKLRDKSIKIAPVEKEMNDIHVDIKKLQQEMVNSSKVEFKLEAQLMRLVLVNRDCKEKLQQVVTAGENDNFGSSNLNALSSNSFFSPPPASAPKVSKNQNEKSPSEANNKHSPTATTTRTRSPSPPLCLRDVISVIESPLAYRRNNNTNDSSSAAARTATNQHFLTTTSVSDPFVTASHYYRAHGGMKQQRSASSSNNNDSNNNTKRKNVVALPSTRQKSVLLVGPSKFSESPQIDAQVVVVSGEKTGTGHPMSMTTFSRHHHTPS